MKFTISILLLFSISIYAQITITKDDISSMFAKGYITTVHDLAANNSIDIGSTGGGNNWDFTSLQAGETYQLKSIDKSEAPNSAEFSGADIVTYENAASDTGQLYMWSFYSLDNSFGSLGSVSVISSLPEDTTTLKNSPARIDAKFPALYNSSWTQNYTQFLIVDGMQVGQSSVSKSVVVDAYGIMTLPGGDSFEAIRLRSTLTVSLPGLPVSNSNVSYLFISKEGAQVSLDGPDNIDLASSGVIDVENYNWNLPPAKPTAVKDNNSQNIPKSYALYQNYPNPFNPTTKIRYSISSAGTSLMKFVQLKVYDILGREVATLVNKQQQPGNYEVDFNGTDLPSGIYIYKLRTGDFLQTKKMTLIK